VSGHAIKIVKYDTAKQYATRYFGFKLHLIDAGEEFVLDMPYSSQILRRFLRVAHNVDWTVPLLITIFKGKKKESSTGSEETGVWFQQRGETVRPYYTREQPHGMPDAVHDADLNEWDFKAQHRWLVDRLKSETIPDIEDAARRVAPPAERASDTTDAPDHSFDVEMPPYSATDEDCPF
jgi:hypothetical protein